MQFHQTGYFRPAWVTTLIPFMNIFLGMVFLKERLTLLQTVSLIAACIGVGVITIRASGFPWIAVSLAATFALYGLMKKISSVPSDTGLTLEAFFASPAAAAVLIIIQIRGNGVIGTLNPLNNTLLAGAGLVSAVPLLLFAEGAKRIPLSRVGFLQFIAPTLMFIVGALVFGEALDHSENNQLQLYLVRSYSFPYSLETGKEGTGKPEGALWIKISEKHTSIPSARFFSGPP